MGWFREAGRALRASDPANWAAGLTMPQLRVMFFLGRAGPASVGEVAAGVGVSQPSATETLDRLVRAGYVKRTGRRGATGRVVRNALSAAGRELIDRAWETRRAVLASALRQRLAGGPRRRSRTGWKCSAWSRRPTRPPPARWKGFVAAPPRPRRAAHGTQARPSAQPRHGEWEKREKGKRQA